MTNVGKKWASKEQLAYFYKLVLDEGWAVSRAAQHLGFTPQWGYGKMRNRERIEDKPVRTRGEIRPPPPLAYRFLDGGVQDTLKDFLLFRQVFLCRDPVPWAADAAHRVTEMLLDSSRRDYVDVNVPPGSGKTTLYTHDLPLWLLCGGGKEDPQWGRALRILLGHETKDKSIHYVLRLRRTLEMTRPFYDKQTKRSADLVVQMAFGRFRPMQTMGEPSVWKNSEFIVAQLEEVDLYEKEPSVQAASREAGFLGERVDYYSWDDLATKKNSKNVEIATSTAEWFEDEAEARLEPGGVGLLVGQRLSNLDLHRNRLDQVVTHEDGTTTKKYHHIIYPAHFDESCDGNHRQWDGDSDGCLLDAKRLPWGDLLVKQASGSYGTVYQQMDTDLDSVLCQEAWLSGGTDADGFPAPGCHDQERGFFDWPNRQTVDYVTVDPSATQYWGIEWWALDMSTQERYLIYGERKKMRAGLDKGFLDFDPQSHKHVGLMEELQQRSGALGHPILVWVVEQNAAHRYLFQTFAYKTWRRKWPMVTVISHETQKNKIDPAYGVDALLPMVYRQGLKRLPRKRGDLQALNFVRALETELTTYPNARTSDLVMADWFGEANLERIKSCAKSLNGNSETIYTSKDFVPVVTSV